MRSIGYGSGFSFNMKRLLILFFVTLGLLTFTPRSAHAQMMGFLNSSVDNAAIQSQQAEEQEGKKLLGQLKNKATTCQKLTNDNFEKIGEYFMGQAIGNTAEHIQMNNMMKSMMGDAGEEQMHIAWGKRSSGCDTNASYLQNSTGITSMMWMMGGGGNPMMGYGGWNNMMGGWGGFGFGWIFMIIFWILVILGVVALVRYLGNSGKAPKDHKTAVEILKERYAKGEIDKKQFEEMKKDVG